MGIVYRAEDLKLGQTVALKFLPDNLAHDPARLDAFYAEVRNARQVSHPNVCRVHDIGEHQGRHFLTMEYVDGEDLASLLRRIGWLPAAKAIELAQQLCAGLAAAHARGVIHRDIKPANVMIDGLGQARLTDFGLAIHTSSTTPGEVAGTILYMAPEQIEGEGGSIRSDLYSLGLVLFEAITGRRPYEAASVAELLQKRKEGVPSPSRSAKDIDPQMERVILQCLERDPSARPGSALEIAAGLPGGDPLAAALAAGHTPSPEMVAAAGKAGGLPLQVAWGWFGAFLGLLALAVVMSAKGSLFGAAHPEKSPEVLAERAQQILKRNGYAQYQRDRAFWFYKVQNVTPRSTVATKGTHSEGKGNPLASLLAFQFRSSPQALVSLNPLDALWVDNPAFDEAGMANVALDTQGTLIRFEAVTKVAGEGSQTKIEPDWRVFFTEAGLDIADFVPVAPITPPIRMFDVRKAWREEEVSDPAAPITIEGAAYGGQPVLFSVTQSEPKASATASRGDAMQNAQGIAFSVFLVVFFILSFYLARRNVRQGRSDLQGAFRLGATIFVAGLAARMIAAHHAYGGPWDLFRFVRTNAASTLWEAAFVGLMYLALEPFARRTCPDLLVGWNKLLAGRFRDTRVGADILFGCTVGALVTTCLLLPSFLPAPLAVPGATNTGMPALLGLRYQLAGIIDLARFGLLGGITLILVLAVGASLTRRRWPGFLFGGLIFIVILTRFVSARVPLPLRLTVTALVTLVLIITLIRLGNLATLVGCSVGSVLTSLPLDLTASPAFVSASWFTLAVIVGLGTYGFLAALGGQDLFGHGLDHD